MHIRNLDLNLLLVFAALYEHRNVTLASRSLGLTQPTVSHSLARLREVFLDPLFVRASGAMLPTAYAESLAKPISQALQLIQESIQIESNFDPKRTTRTFSFLLTDAGSLAVLPKLARQLQLSAPGAIVRVINAPTHSAEKLLESGEADLAIGPFPAMGDTIFQQRLYERAYVCAFRSDHPRIKSRLSLKQYLSLDHLIVASPTRMHEVVDREIKAQGLSRRIALTTPYWLSVPFLLEATDLIATVPRDFAIGFSSVARIRSVASPMKTGPIKIHQYWHERVHHDPVNRWLRRLVSELFSR